ncbi:tol-pal system YbgF family protein [Desulfurivibrio sp. D14AmB]|uniref:tetratricopeptide repeat protein n=1 Tax=Desulfurivibrio sp. D14AmB TaxID=3374370 RepID=UPI00376F09DB
MPKKILICSITWLLLLSALPAATQAADRYYLLAQARAALSLGEQETAIEKYTEYIAAHPAITGRKTASFRRNSQYYLRNLLIAYGGLIEQQQALGLYEQAQQNLDRLQQVRQDNKFGSKNLYNLAIIYRDHGRTREARAAMQTIVADQQRAPQKTNNKAFVRASAELVKIHQEEDDQQALAAVLDAAVNGIELFGLDLKDRYRIGRLLLDNGDRLKGEKILRDMVQFMTLDDLAAEEHALIRALSALLRLNATNHEAATQLLAALDRFEGVYELSLRNQYSLAIACLNTSHHQARGLRMLTEIKDQFPATTHARRALFVLGRTAASAEEWGQAMHHYQEYIDRYPEPRFFSLKAYSRLIDSQWAKLKDHELIRAESRRLADLVNDIADYETQLNLARDLRDKGFDELAAATFSLGEAAASEQLRREQRAEARLRILWNLQRYGYPIERFSLVEESAAAALELIDDPRNTSMRAKESTNFIKSQSLIWLGQAQRRQQRPEAARNTFATFLKEFPDSPDADYVRFSLAEIHEEEGETAQADELYRRIESGVWRERAERRQQRGSSR